MFNFQSRIFKRFFGAEAETQEFINMARITEGNQLFVNGELIGTYSRRRDAVRGAKRRGLVIA
jgi:hypothetical protein